MTKILAVLILTASLLFVINCGSKKVPKDLTDEQLYDAAIKELTADKGGFPWIFRGRDYDMIFAYLKEIQLRYTYSPYAALAELRTGDAYFQKEEYEQAAIEYEEFLKRHPGHAEAPYATYRLALSYYKEIKSPDRDPLDTRLALQWFNTFIEKYPDSPLAPDARERALRCRDRLARREIYIGNFYSRRDNYKAAADRYKIVVDDYNDTQRYQEALYLLGKAYAKSDQYDLARQALNRLVQEYPNEKYSGKATSLLNDIQGKTAPPPQEEKKEEPAQPQQG
ncbi:MAG TPA: outer membrane protein assembly factor BamD [Thermodesulfobacteriota bacterium]|nr:outer membrane protein assembly factor BamD [Thermodesulfobacteriota bacterium]